LQHLQHVLKYPVQEGFFHQSASSISSPSSRDLNDDLVGACSFRLGIATGQGHAAMIYEGFGKWWGRFSLFDLLLVNFLALVTEFASSAPIITSTC
jgi:hypothetical protein